MIKQSPNTEKPIDHWCQEMKTGNIQELISTLQDISNSFRSDNEDHIYQMQDQLRELINRSSSGWSSNQVILSSSLRTYFHILHRSKKVDTHFQDLDKNRKDAPFILYAMLSTDYHKCLEQEFLQEKCLQTLSASINSNFSHLVPILRALNLLYKKYNIPKLDISLETFYSCMQSNRLGARDEALILFRYSTLGFDDSVELFNLIINYWPWTNKNKYYLLSVILGTHNLKSLAKHCEFNEADFFNGLRLGLSYKSTFSASQSLVRVLSKQHSHQLLELSIEILKNGTEREIVNFHTQWFTHIIQKDELYRMLQLENCREVSFRYIFLVCVFSKQMSVASQNLDELGEFLRENCFNLTMDTQMYVFKFYVDNLASLKFPVSLEFLSEFIEMHRCTECPQVRHTILGKFPIVFNFIAKMFCTLKEESCGPAKDFFRKLFELIEKDMQNALYQPLIFSLKALDRILQILFSDSSKNVSKACKLEQNKELGEFLVKERIFDVKTMNRIAFEVLNSPECYDDARELVVLIIKQLKVQSLREASRRCAECSESIEIDEVAQSAIFARLCIHCSRNEDQGSACYPRELLSYSVRRVGEILKVLEVDPLNICKNEGHIFGHMSVINEVLNEESQSSGLDYESLLKMVEDVILLHLKLLNAAAKEGSTAASFQVMDKSLQLLVEKSTIERRSDEECRKFLMLSFWMALKSSCEVATTIGRNLTNQAESDPKVLKLVEKCLNVSVTVLLRCRHKGAIEAAGVTLGKLVKLLTSHSDDSKCYSIVYKCLDLLFEKVNQISTTRRGAGLTIMFLHLVKNEVRRERPLTHRAVKMLINRIENGVIEEPASIIHTNDSEPTYQDEAEQNFDSVHALVLHYLCVIVKDTELRDTVSEYYDEIMMAAILRIDNPEWTICNAALQLFGALVPKIVGQKQATEMVIPVCWEPTEVTFLEVNLKLPRTCEHILGTSNVSTRKLILFLEFLSNVEHLKKSEKSISPMLERFRELFWTLLSHECEKVRKLSATCFVRAHEFREDLPVVLLQLAEVIFKIHNENFFQGLLFTINEGIHKIDVEWKHTSVQSVDEFLEVLRNTFRASYKYRPLSFYTRAILMDFFLLTGFDSKEELVKEILQKDQQQHSKSQPSFGFDLFKEKVLEYKD